MTSLGEGPQPNKTSEEIIQEIKKLVSDVQVLEKYTTSAGLIGTAIGSITAILVGPIAFVSGAGISALAVLLLKSYVAVRKKALEGELGVLQKEGHIADNIAAELKAKLASVHTDDPREKSPGSSDKQSTDEAN